MRKDPVDPQHACVCPNFVEMEAYKHNLLPDTWAYHPFLVLYLSIARTLVNHGKIEALVCLVDTCIVYSSGKLSTGLGMEHLE